MIDVKNITKSFGSLTVLKGVSTHIEDGERVAKYHPEMPEKIVNIVKCKNPRCITSTEQELPHIFKLTDADSRTYRCIYCESKAK